MSEKNLLQFSWPLSNLIQSCETFCVAACCGLDAFDIREEQISKWIETVSSEDAHFTLQQVQELIDQVRTGGLPVNFEQFNACWSAEECIAWLEEFKTALNAAIKTSNRSN